MLNKVKDKLERHAERHTPSGCDFVIADSIDYLNNHHWDSLADTGSVFLSRRYLQSIEEFPPSNTVQRYAIAYRQNRPVVIVACQVAEISGDLAVPATSRYRKTLFGKYNERVLVCGNLVSSGLHGVAFADEIDSEKGWRILSEALYRIRRAEKINGSIDFVLVKDIKGELLDNAKIMERYSYRRIQTDPDMVLELAENTKCFDDYLACLTTKYRNRIKKTIKTLDQAGFNCIKSGMLDDELDSKLHKLYMNVEQKSATRFAALPRGYFSSLHRKMPDIFSFHLIQRNDEIAGFICMIREGKYAVAYYVGIDYEINRDFPIYHRLLQLAVESAIDMGCHYVVFGRTALEPKAGLGAKPVDAFVLARHRVPVVNYMVRKLFKNVPFDEAPQRRVLKQ